MVGARHEHSPVIPNSPESVCCLLIISKFCCFRCQICVFPSAWNIRGFWVLKPLYAKYENLVSYYAPVQVLSSLMKWIYNCNYLVHYSHRDSNFPLPKHWIWLIPVRWRAWRADTAKNTVILIISVKSVEETSQVGKRGSEMTWCWLWV